MLQIVILIVHTYQPHLVNPCAGTTAHAQAQSSVWLHMHEMHAGYFNKLCAHSHVCINVVVHLKYWYL